MGFLAALIPSIIGAGASLLGQHSQNKQAKQQYDSEQEKAHQAYNMNMYRFNQALQRYHLKKGLVNDFISTHGLNPGKGVSDYLNAPDPTAPDFASIGGSTFRGGPPTDYGKLGGTAAAAAAKLFAPKQATPGTDSGVIGSPTGVGAPVPAETPKVDVGAIEQNAGLVPPMDEKRFG